MQTARFALVIAFESGVGTAATAALLTSLLQRRAERRRREDAVFQQNRTIVEQKLAALQQKRTAEQRPGKVQNVPKYRILTRHPSERTRMQ